MSFSSRAVLANYLKVVLTYLVGCYGWYFISVAIGVVTHTLWPTALRDLFYFWSFWAALILTPYTLMFLWRGVFKNIQHHRDIARSKIGSSSRTYSKRSEKGQALDLLKDVLFALDWMPLRSVNALLARQFRGPRAITVSLENPTWEVLTRFFSPIPELVLWDNCKEVARLPIYK